jgi:Copper transport outer membrane protein, MctB
LIDFRYHLVSIIAVFLALAIGLIVGAEALQPGTTSVLQQEVKTARQNNNNLSKQDSQLTKQLGFDNAFAQAAAGRLLPGLLSGQSVVLVLAPGADSTTVNGITTAVKRAGGKVTGQVLLSSAFFDLSTSTESVLHSTATDSAPAGVRIPSSSSNLEISGQLAAAEVIAAAIVNKDGLATMTAPQSQAILNAFGQQGFLQVNGPSGPTLTGQATMAVVVIPATVPSLKVSGPFNLALISLTQDLQEASKGAVLAGNYAGSGSGSAINLVTNGGVSGVAPTTVDDASTETGQIVVVQALREMLTGHYTPANYGDGPAAAPSPAPSPTPSASVSPETTKRPRK